MPIREDRELKLIANPSLPDIKDGESVLITRPACSDKRIQIIVPAAGHVDGLIKVRFWKGQQEEGQASSLVDRIPLRNQTQPQATESMATSQNPPRELENTDLTAHNMRRKSIASLPDHSAGQSLTLQIQNCLISVRLFQTTADISFHC